MQVSRFALGICLFLLSFSTSALSQDDKTGSIAGTIQDNTAAVVVGVPVQLLNAAGVAQTTNTDEKGEYKFAGLAPGSYTIVVTLQGFKEFRSQAVRVTAGQTTRVDASLEPASVTEKVNVEGNTVTQVEQQSSQISGTVTSKELTSLMLNGRNFTQLIALTPGVSNQTGQDEALVGVKGSVKYSVNGGRVEYNSYEVDGGDIQNASINGSSTTLIVYPSIDAIGSLQVLTSNYGAMYGKSASGITVATTKSGADFSGYHGDAYLFVRNETLNARNFFDETRHAPLYRKYDFGATLGGPLYIPGVFNTKKDKTFFFFSEEYRHEQDPVEFNQAVPSVAERNGDFRDVCPTSGVPADNTGQDFLFTRSLAAFESPGNTMHVPYFPDCPSTDSRGLIFISPGNSQPEWASGGNYNAGSPVTQAILNSGLIPLPNSVSGCNSTAATTITDQLTGAPISNPRCYVSTISPLTTWREELFRIDHNFAPSEKLSLRYIHDAWSTQVVTPQWGLYHNGFPTVENNFTGPGLSVVAHLTSTIGSKFVNDVAMAYTTDHIQLTNFGGPGVTSLNRSSYPGVTQSPCFQPPTCNGGVGYLFGTPANDVNGVPFGNKLPAIVISGSNFAYGGQGFAADTGYMPWHHSNPTYSPRDDATLILGKHSIAFGALAVIAQRNEVNPPVGANTGDVQGTFIFSNVNQVTTGNAFADFMIFGTNNVPPKTYTQDSAQGVYHNNYMIVEPYVQDDWKITRRLTLNLGFRASLFGLYHEKNLASYNWVPSQFNSALASQLTYVIQTGALAIPGAAGQPPTFLSTDLNNLSPYLANGIVRCGVSKYNDGTQVPSGCMTGKLFNPAPRIGFAWDPFGKGKMSVRGGYGIFFEHGTGNETNTGSLEGSPGNANAGGVVNMTQYGVVSWACAGNFAPGCTSTAQNQGTTFPISVTAIPTKVTWPYVQQWNFSVQSELPGHLLGSVAYVGSKGTHLAAELNLNQLVPVNQSQNPFLPGQPLTIDYCEAIAVAVNGGTASWNGNPLGPQFPGWSNSLAACYGSPIPRNVVQLPSILPGELRTPGNVIAPFVGQIYSLQNIANSNYHAFQVSVRRTLAPLTLGISYSFSHSIDDASDRTEATFIDAYNLPSNRASSDFDQRHSLTVSYVYQLPLMKLIKALNFADDDPTNQVSSHGVVSRFWDGWEASGITVFQTGTPFSILNAGTVDGIGAADNAGVVTLAGPASYPDLAKSVAQVPGGLVYPNAFGPLLGNPNRFVAPTGLTFGDAGRNYLNNPRRTNFDLALAKNFSMTERRSLQFRVESFNLFNHTQFRVFDPSNPASTGNNVVNCYAGTNLTAGDVGCLQSSSFLHPVDAHRPRTIQLGVKFLF